jgi:hypothetical protein
MKLFPNAEDRKEIGKKARELAFLVVAIEILAIIAFALACRYDIIKAEGEKLIIPVSAHEKAPEIVPEQPKKDHVDEIAETIWMKESTQGKHNYSKCEAQGLTNGIGYAIPGDGTYRCFKDHAEEMQVLKGWIRDHISQGMTEKELLCHYSGSNYNFCQK